MRLPLNCTVDYISDFLDEEEAWALYNELIKTYHIDKARLIIDFDDKKLVTDSRKILFATEELIMSNSHPENIHGKSFVWTGLMRKLKDKVEAFSKHTFELAMCLYYPNGTNFAPYHFDQETSGYKTILPSLSLGEVRPFCFRENSSQEVYSLNLANGSLVVMGDYCQSRYEHSLPKYPICKNPRINITFREANFK